MTLSNVYKLQNKTLKELLNELDVIITNINTFKQKHSGYLYDIKVTSNNNLWDAEIKIKHEKQINKRLLKEVS
jgi:hypothetical protein